MKKVFIALNCYWDGDGYYTEHFMGAEHTLEDALKLVTSDNANKSIYLPNTKIPSNLKESFIKIISV